MYHTQQMIYKNPHQSQWTHTYNTKPQNSIAQELIQLADILNSINKTLTAHVNLHRHTAAIIKVGNMNSTQVTIKKERHEMKSKTRQ